MGLYTGSGSVAAGATLGILNLHNTNASPRSRAYLSEIMLGSVTTPADHATKLRIVRTTSIGTEDAGFLPLPIDPATPAMAASQWDFGVGFSGGQPSKTDQLLMFSFNQRNTVRWIARPGSELIAPATQNNGLCLESVSSTGTPLIDATMFFSE